MNFLSRFTGGSLSGDKERTKQFFQAISQLYEQQIALQNTKVEHDSLKLTVSVPALDSEELARLLISTQSWALSICAKRGSIQFFSWPTSDFSDVRAAETVSRLRLTVAYDKKQECWSVDGVPADPTELNTLLRTLFKDIILKSKQELHVDSSAKSWTQDSPSMVSVMRDLIAEKHILVQKIVRQQESVQRRIASDIHDEVMTDLLLLKRSLIGTDAPAPAAVAKEIDLIHRKLREVCSDLAPRDIYDCGLQVVLDDLVQHFGERHQVDAVFDCHAEIPDLPDDVVLHVYRIIQEALNNVAKHAQATKVWVRAALDHGRLTFTVQDNGKSIAAPVGTTQEPGGMGMNILRERTALINEQLPAQLTVEKIDGMRVTLTIKATAGQ